MKKIKFTIITLFPEAIKPYLDSSMLYKAQDRGLAEFELVNLRDFGLGVHKSVDDTPYGGGDGMLLRCEPVFAAIESVKAKDSDAKVILPTPAGRTWNQALAQEIATKGEETFLRGYTEATAEYKRVPPVTTGWHDASPVKCSSPFAHYIILCPHYEGYDQRIMSIVDLPVCLGNFILTGGELPALCIIDSVVRLIPGVLGGETSAEIESFSDGDNIEYPQYTKPADFRGMKVPDVLLSGHHGKIAEWRTQHSTKKDNHHKK